jgi:hypothetical protein
VRLKQIEGCWQHSKPREFNIALGPDLEQLLRAQLEGRKLDLPECWYEDQSGQIVLIAGEACTAHDEFKFRKTDGEWELVRAERQELVSCYQKKK